MSIKVISHTSKKLIIQSPNIFENFIFIICMAPFVTTSFLFASSLIYEFKMLKALDSSNLSCYRDREEVSCSLTGFNLYGNVEKVFSIKNRNLIRWVKSESAGSVSHEGDEYSVVLITTEREELFLFTPTKLVDDQVSKLNNFLINPDIAEFHIHNQLSYQRNWMSSICLFIFYGGITIFWGGVTFISIFVLIINICIATNYIFDKEKGELISQRLFCKIFLPPIPDIPLCEIKIVHLEMERGVYERIYLSCESGLLSIYVNHYSGSPEIAELICSFLQLEPYQTIEVPP